MRNWRCHADEFISVKNLLEEFKDDNTYQVFEFFNTCVLGICIRQSINVLMYPLQQPKKKKLTHPTELIVQECNYLPFLLMGPEFPQSICLLRKMPLAGQRFPVP